MASSSERQRRTLMMESHYVHYGAGANLVSCAIVKIAAVLSPSVVGISTLYRASTHIGARIYIFFGAHAATAAIFYTYRIRKMSGTLTAV
ncbi:hypothetical protein BC939DRAFT_455110 [Gamsiella multidivaricata]|uniref:uncharacterized protein n=1 Tax=Gamsiella multidivaricata TaxID=101098 RepID=UPI00221E81DC|nr:uncharacterized protein BC939DRAFT_455110 [Gamsiella multidivaricata]KAI7821684.1 hypothetical protein BC939DRAFT_455110 [Gamsiella multidivaricata]